MAPQSRLATGRRRWSPFRCWPQLAGPNRSGATLVEVLMSLMVMGIGIVSVVTMFPIAALKSIQATQLTNARMLRKNAEEAFRMQYQSSATPAVRFDLLNYTRGTGLTRFKGEWQPNTSYEAGDLVTPTRKKGLPHPVPNRWFVMRPVEMGSATTASPLNSGYVEPNWLTSAATFETIPGGSDVIEWTVPTSTAFGPANYSLLNYVVDPLGWWQYQTHLDDISPALTHEFGYVVSGGVVASPASPRLLRLNGGTASLAAAEQVALHPDSWSVQIADNVTAATSNSANFRGAVDLSGILNVGSNAFPPRIVLTSNLSEQAIVRPIVAPLPGGGATDWTVNWNEPLPASFQADGVCRIESYEPRFSWMATVNKLADGAQKVTLAVFFRRAFTPENEHIYTADYTVGLADQVQVRWTVGSSPEPLLKEGNYFLDGLNLVWYRIVAVDAPAVAGTVKSSMLTLDRPVPAPQRISSGRAILMRGIIHLFEL